MKEKDEKPKKNRAAVALAKARAAALTPEQRKKIAHDAAVKRWGDKKKTGESQQEEGEKTGE